MRPITRILGKQRRGRSHRTAHQTEAYAKAWRRSKRGQASEVARGVIPFLYKDAGGFVQAEGLKEARKGQGASRNILEEIQANY